MSSINPTKGTIQPQAGASDAMTLSLLTPSAPLSAIVQAMWSVTTTQAVTKPLYADAGSGVIFNLSGHIGLGKYRMPRGVIMLPVNAHSDTISLPAGAVLAGVRFHPAIGFGILGQHYAQPTLLAAGQPHLNLLQIFTLLRTLSSNAARLSALNAWAHKTLSFSKIIPDPLEAALSHVAHDSAISDLSITAKLSQRQLERQFKAYLGMTPKYYQRILRIKRTMAYLRQNENADLAEAAYQFGFSDQAHMTREFRTVAHTTPSQAR